MAENSKAKSGFQRYCCCLARMASLSPAKSARAPTNAQGGAKRPSEAAAPGSACGACAQTSRSETAARELL